MLEYIVELVGEEKVALGTDYPFPLGELEPGKLIHRMLYPNNVKEKFANDKLNHVASCTNINSSKGSSTPKDFLRKSRDGKGLEYSILPVCSYLEIYYKVKLKYDLSFSANDPELFLECGLNTKIQVNKHSIIE